MVSIPMKTIPLSVQPPLEGPVFFKAFVLQISSNGTQKRGQKLLDGTQVVLKAHNSVVVHKQVVGTILTGTITITDLLWCIQRSEGPNKHTALY